MFKKREINFPGSLLHVNSMKNAENKKIEQGKELWNEASLMFFG